MRATIKLAGDKRLRAALDRIVGVERKRALYDDLCLWAQSVIQRQFISRAPGARTGGWPGVVWWAKVISANVGRGRGRIRTFADANRARRAPLMDQGALKQSWLADSARRTGDGWGEVGTHLPYAEAHQLGERVVFHFDADKQQRFRHNVDPGSKGAWNQDYFIMRAVLRRKDGQFVQLRKREQIPPDIGQTPDDRRRIARIIQLHLDAALDGGGE